MAKKDKKLKDKSKKVAKAAVAEDNLDVTVEEAPTEIVAGDVVHESIDEETGEVHQIIAVEEEAPKARSKRAPKKKVEIPASSLEFIAEFPIDDILPRERNTRFRGKETERVLSQMIQRFGWTQPLTLDSEHRIVDGQYRYELAKKWGVKTVPVVVTDGVSVEAGTTDLFHMLSGRIAEWDKWNYPATDAVLKSLDGGLTTERILDFEADSEAGPLRDLAREIGWFINIIPTTLSGSTVTLETLGGLLKKQLAGKYHYDPAQLLYIEPLRHQLQLVRQEMVDNGETAGGVKPKLEQHIAEETKRQEDGNAIAEEKGYELELSEDGTAAVFTADKEITYVVNKVAAIEEAAKVQIRSARDMESRFREMADGKKVGLTQFKILASYFSDLTPEEAGDFFNGKSASEFNLFVDSILEENRTISPNRSKNFPMTEAELRAEQYRLRGEDIRKDNEKSKKDEPKGLSSLLVDELKALLKEEGLPLSGKKAELVERLEAAGYGPDGTKGEAPASEAEEAEDGEASELILVDEHAESTADGEDAEQPEETSDSPEENLETAPDLWEKDSLDSDAAAAKEAPVDIKALKKRGKALKAKSEEGELSKAELKEFKAIRKQLKAARA